jgi:hypothetical protein
MLYMTIIVIGRPPVPTTTDSAVVFVTVAIMISASVIPAFVAELARLYFEVQGQDSYITDPKVPHVIVTGDINTSRLKAFLGQFFHKSRDSEVLCPVVILAEHKYEGALRTLVEQSRYGGTVDYIRGTARAPADLKRAGVKNASTVILLVNRLRGDAAESDSEIVAACLAIKAVNKRVRILAQLRRPRAVDHVMVLPGWRDHDRAVALASLAMTLVGVGSIIPGLPTLLTNLIHQGNKGMARSANPRRRMFLAHHARLSRQQQQMRSAGMLVAAQERAWWEVMMSNTTEYLNEHVLKRIKGEHDRGDARAADGALLTEAELLREFMQPVSPLEEYTMGFAQEMYAFAVTPGLAGRTFATAARLAYLRYGILLIGARVPITLSVSTANVLSPADLHTAPTAATQKGGPENDPAYQVLLFPSELTLRQGMYVHAIGFDTIDLATLLQGTGGEHALKQVGAALARTPKPSHGMKANSSFIELSASAVQALGDVAVRREDVGLSGTLHFCRLCKQSCFLSLALAFGISASLSIATCCLTWSCEQVPVWSGAVVHSYDTIRTQQLTSLYPGASRSWKRSVQRWLSMCTTSRLAVRSFPLRLLLLLRFMIATPLFYFVAADDQVSVALLKNRTAALCRLQCSCIHNEAWSVNMVSAHKAKTSNADSITAQAPRHGHSHSNESEKSNQRLLSGTMVAPTESWDSVMATNDASGHEIASPTQTRGRKNSQQRSRGPSDEGIRRMDTITSRISEEEEEEELEDEEADEGGEGGTEIGGMDLPSDEEELEDDLDMDMQDEDGFTIADPDDRKPGRHASDLSGSQGLGNRGGRRRNRAMSDADSVFTTGDDGLGGRDDLMMPSFMGGHGRRGTMVRTLSRRQSIRKHGNPASPELRGKAPTQAIVPAAPPADTRKSFLTRTGVGSGFTFQLHLPSPIVFRPVITANRQSMTLSPYQDHLLVCGISDRIGLLLRGLAATNPPPPKCFMPGLPATLSRQANLFQDQLQRKYGSNAPPFRTPQVVVLCPISDRPSEAAVNALFAGSDKWLHRVEWVNGNPSDMGDLLRAGVESARAAIVLSTRRAIDGHDNLGDDVEAIVIASSIYKLNPALHIMTEVVHGPHASYLRPAGTNLTDAEESTSAFVASIKAAAAMRARQERKKRQLEKFAAAAALGAVSPAKPPRKPGMGRSASNSGLNNLSQPNIAGAAATSSALVPANAPPPPPPHPSQMISLGTVTLPAIVGQPSTSSTEAAPESILSPISPSETSVQPVVSEAHAGDDSPHAGPEEANQDTNGKFNLMDRLAKEKIRLALAAGDSIGRTAMAVKPQRRAPLRGLFDKPMEPQVEVSSPHADTPTEDPASMLPTGAVGITVAPPVVQPSATDGWGAPESVPIVFQPAPVPAQSPPTPNPPIKTPLPALASGEGLGRMDSFTLNQTAQPSTMTAWGSDPAALAVAFPAHNSMLQADMEAAGIFPPAPVLAAATSSTDVGSTRPNESSTSAPAPPTASQSRAGLIAAEASAPVAVAPSDLFGAPAFAAGRAFSATTIDALLCEAHFAPHIIYIIKQLVRASRKQQLQLLPVRDAVAMAMLANPLTTSSMGEPQFTSINTFGKLFESLLRGWQLLPVGLYRRREPGIRPTPPTVEDPAAHFMAAFGGIIVPGISADTSGAWFNGCGSSGTAGIFRNEKTLLSYVFTNPPPHTILNEHDLVYVLRAGGDSGSDD